MCIDSSNICQHGCKNNLAPLLQLTYKFHLVFLYVRQMQLLDLYGQIYMSTVDLPCLKEVLKTT